MSNAQISVHKVCKSQDFLREVKIFFGFCGHSATIKVRQNFICGHAATLPRSKNFEIDTLAKIDVDLAQNIFYESCNQSFNFTVFWHLFTKILKIKFFFSECQFDNVIVTYEFKNEPKIETLFPGWNFNFINLEFISSRETREPAIVAEGFKLSKIFTQVGC